MRPFLDTLADLLGEERLEHYQAQLADLTQEVSDQRKKGSLSLTVNLTPNGDTSFKVSATLKTTTPTPSFGERIVFHTANGDILRDNPNQRKFPFDATVRRDDDGGEAREAAGQNA